ncbi:beta-lactamase-like protein [Entophlyctis helioformis]|nr:beta-lactamase-like protein [Entophlyctis helioformis]
MRFHLQILGTHSGDTTPSIMLHFDTARYMFNCGEGTQRLCVETRRRLAKLRALFFTRTKWDTLGGVPGMILTVADAGITTFQLYGPQNLAHAIAGTRGFVHRPGINMQIQDIVNDADFAYKDENLHVRAVTIRPDTEGLAAADSQPRSESQDRDHIYVQDVVQRMFPPIVTTNGSAGQQAPEAASSHPLAEQQVQVQRKSTAGNDWQTRLLPTVHDDRSAISYICRGPEQIGKLDINMAKSLGVKVGPNLAKLKAGQSVVAMDGSTVHPHQCVEPTQPGLMFMIVDCPSVAYIAPLVSNPAMIDAAAATSPESIIRCVVHICGDDVLTDQRYMDWMASFPATTQHVYMSERHNQHDLMFESYAVVQNKLNALDAKMFPLPYIKPRLPETTTIVEGLPRHARPAELLLSVSLGKTVEYDASECRPPFAFDRTSREYQAFIADAKPVLSRVRQAETVRKRSHDSAFDSIAAAEEGGDVVVTTLGTGSAIPGKYRNVSSTILETPTGTIILDAGEGTLGQLYRRFGPAGMDEALKSLVFVFVSHMHADHHLGLIGVLVRWHALTRDWRNMLVLVGPASLWRWLSEYEQIEDIGLWRIVFVDSADLTRNWDAPEPAPQVMDPGLLATMGLSSLNTISVVHCQESYAMVAETTSGFKFGFSGDCRPSKVLARAAQHADILIHEATLYNDMKKEAIQKRHCTMEEAISVGLQAKAKHLLLTHFSQRYPKVPNLETQHIRPDSPSRSRSRSRSRSPDSGRRSSDAMVTGISFDLMSITTADFWKMPLLMPALQTLFSQEEDTIDGGSGDRDA